MKVYIRCGACGEHISFLPKAKEWRLDDDDSWMGSVCNNPTSPDGYHHPSGSRDFQRASRPGGKDEHRVKVRKAYRVNVNGEPYPWKWQFDCTCGAGGLSWAWDREYEVIQSGMTREQWIEEQGGEPIGGALPMALAHLEEAYADYRQAVESIQTAIETVGADD